MEFYEIIYAKKKEKRKEYIKKYNEQNKEELKEYQRDYYQRNKPRIQEYLKKIMKKESNITNNII